LSYEFPPLWVFPRLSLAQAIIREWCRLVSDQRQNIYFLHLLVAVGLCFFCWLLSFHTAIQKIFCCSRCFGVVTVAVLFSFIVLNSYQFFAVTTFFVAPIPDGLTVLSFNNLRLGHGDRFLCKQVFNS